MSQTVAVIGLGRVGLPLALFLAERGCTVHGVDASADVLDTLRAGRMPFLEEGGPELLSRHLGRRFLPGDDLAVVRQVQPRGRAASCCAARSRPARRSISGG